jgi:thimet oligopeptidase
MLADIARAQSRLASQEQPSARALFEQLDAITRREEDTLGPLGVLAAVSPRKSIRDASDECERDHDAWSARFFQNADIYARLQQAVPDDEIDRRFQRDALDAFEDAGVALSADRQRRVRELREQLTQLTQTFERRLREDRTELLFSKAELAGVPSGVWSRAPRDVRGRYRLGLSQPTVVAVLENATLSATRERMWRAFLSQGGVDNIDTLFALATARHELAGNFGFASYADFVLRRRMAHSESEVQAFLATVKDAVRDRELADLAELRAEKARDLRQPVEAIALERWDVAFYSERLRQSRHAVDQEQFRRHFPPEASLAWVFRLAEKLFGVVIAPLPGTTRTRATAVLRRPVPQ